MMTEPKRLRQALDSAREIELRLQALADNLPGGMVYQVDTGLSGEERRLNYVSRGVEQLHEVSLDQITEDPSFIYKTIEPGDLRIVAEREAVAIKTMTPFSVDVRVTLPSGKKAWRSFVSAPRVMDDGRLIWDGLEIDITARKLAEEQKNVLQEQLMQAQKMDSIGHLAGGIAHDFNNMLSVILGHAEIALGRMTLDGFGPDNPLYADLTSIRAAAERSAALTRQLLAFARKQTASPRVLDLNETVSGMLTMLERLIGEDIDLVWTPGCDVGKAFIDPTQLDQILVNLCVNSRDAICGVGTIRIETSRAVVGDEYCLVNPGCRPGTYSVLAVTDDGCGMDAATIDRVFEPFFTTKEVGKGTGLGLPTVYGIVRQNGGFIKIVSEPGHGTTFRIYLPCIDETSCAPPRIPRTAPVSRAKESILLVEDEPLIRDLTRMMLDSLGYSVMTAATPGEALRLARRHKGQINLLLSDVVMPEMGGRELAEAIRAIHPDCRLLFTSGYTADLIARHGILDPDVKFLPKPFTLEDLATMLRDVLDG